MFFKFEESKNKILFVQFVNDLMVIVKDIRLIGTHFVHFLKILDSSSKTVCKPHPLNWVEVTSRWLLSC